MAVKLRQSQRGMAYFVTFTCYRWLPLFEEPKLYDNLYNWFGILNEQGVKVMGYVFMRSAAQPNHIHCLLYLSKESPELFKIISNAKRFMAYEIVKRLKLENKTNLLRILQSGVSVKESNKGKLHQVFEESYDAKECFTMKFIQQKLDYIHKNPLSGKWNLATGYLQYPYSSARFYDLNEHDERHILTHYQEIGL